MLKAQSEILRLPRLGWIASLQSMLIDSWTTGKMVSVPIKVALPLQYHEFNLYHHGRKVIKQDLMVLEDLVAEGKQEGHEMVLLREVIRRTEGNVSNILKRGC